MSTIYLMIMAHDLITMTYDGNIFSSSLDFILSFSLTGGNELPYSSPHSLAQDTFGMGKNSL